MKEKNLQAGKLPTPLLERLLEEYAWTDDSVVVGPGIGVDAAVVEVGGRLLVLKSDPITFTAENLGPWALTINANDVAVLGAVPRWFLATVLLPAGEIHETDVEEIMKGLAGSCREMGISLCGGHTEITDAVVRPVLCGFLAGEVGPRGVITSRMAAAGELLVLTKGIAIEGTAVLARESRERLGHLGEDLLERASSFDTKPGIGIIEEAKIAAAMDGVTAMHDPTEGGLATALCELATASDTGAELFPDRIRVYPETRSICRELGLDPMGLLASGALLIAVKEEAAPDLCRELARCGIEADVIGRLTDDPGNLAVREGAGTKPLKRFDRDEVARILVP